MIAFAAATAAMVVIGALLTLRTPAAIRRAAAPVQRVARFERGIARIVVIALVAVGVVAIWWRNRDAGGFAMMAGMMSVLGLAVLAGAVTMAARLSIRYRNDGATWRALGNEVAGFALMGLGSLMRYGPGALP